MTFLYSLCLASFYHFYKICMHTCIIIQLWMKCCRKLIFLSGRYHFSIYYGQCLCIFIDISNIWRTDECHWNLSKSFHLIFCVKTSKLPSISISLCQNIHRTKALDSIFHLICQQDQTGTSSKYRKSVFNLLF